MSEDSVLERGELALHKQESPEFGTGLRPRTRPSTPDAADYLAQFLAAGKSGRQGACIAG